VVKKSREKVDFDFDLILIQFGKTVIHVKDHRKRFNGNNQPSMESVIESLERIRRGGFTDSSFLLPLAPGCLVRGRIPNSSRVEIPSGWMSPPTVNPGWLTIDEAMRECMKRKAQIEAGRERVYEQEALLACSEGEVQKRVTERMGVFALLGEAFDGREVKYLSENVVEVKEKSGESVCYITEKLEDSPGYAPSSQVFQDPPPLTAQKMDPARQRAIMKRLEYMEALEAGKASEWSDSEGKEPLSPIQPKRDPVIVPPNISTPKGDYGTSTASSLSHSATLSNPSAPAEEPKPQQTRSLFMQRMLEKRK